MKINCNISSQGGSILLEALISILIFSIGILGLVGMQAAAISSTSDAQYRSTAGFLVDQMIGTVWATRIPSPLNAASNVVAANPNPALVCIYPCNIQNPGANANNYLQSWASSVQSVMPVNLTYASVAISGPVVTVGISWRTPNQPAAEPNHQQYAVTYIN